MQLDDRDVDLVAAPPGRSSPGVAVVLAVAAALLAFGCATHARWQGALADPDRADLAALVDSEPALSAGSDGGGNLVVLGADHLFSSHQGTLATWPCCAPWTSRCAATAALSVVSSPTKAPVSLPPWPPTDVGGTCRSQLRRASA